MENFFYSFQKGRFSTRGRCNRAQCTPSVTPLIIWQNYIPLSYLHYIYHRKYVEKVDKPMIYVMIGSKADTRELI